MHPTMEQLFEATQQVNIVNGQTTEQRRRNGMDEWIRKRNG